MATILARFRPQFPLARNLYAFSFLLGEGASFGPLARKPLASKKVFNQQAKRSEERHQRD